MTYWIARACKSVVYKQKKIVSLLCDNIVVLEIIAYTSSDIYSYSYIILTSATDFHQMILSNKLNNI